jgi:hypothetical protein
LLGSLYKISPPDVNNNSLNVWSPRECENTFVFLSRHLFGVDHVQPLARVLAKCDFIYSANIGTYDEPGTLADICKNSELNQQKLLPS